MEKYHLQMSTRLNLLGFWSLEEDYKEYATEHTLVIMTFHILPH